MLKNHTINYEKFSCIYLAKPIKDKSYKRNILKSFEVFQNFNFKKIRENKKIVTIFYNYCLLFFGSFLKKIWPDWPKWRFFSILIIYMDFYFLISLQYCAPNCQAHSPLGVRNQGPGSWVWLIMFHNFRKM